MSDFQFIECQPAKELMSSGALLFDIRDQNSFLMAHPNEAIHLHNDNLSMLLSPLDKDQTILVLCYKGNSSQGAAQFIYEQGFKNVFSVNGGFNTWQALYPTEITSS